MQYKEFLNKNNNYNLVILPEHAGDDERSGLIEVPDGAQLLSTDGYGKGLIFWKDDFNLVVGLDDCWDRVHQNFNDFFSKYPRCKLLWQRYTQPESLPFIDDEVIEIEFTTDIKKYEEFQRDIEKSYNHYFKDVSNLKFIDVYRVLDLFAVEHPCLQHSVKKLLCAGQRGSKNRDKDIQEAIDSLLRYQEMRSEDNQ